MKYRLATLFTGASSTPRFWRVLGWSCVLLLAPLPALAQAVTGTITNGTSGKPAAGIEVALVDPMQGMAELTTTKTDAAGKFSLSAGQAQGPRLVRATRDGVNYFHMITPGTSSVALEVYDGAKKVDGIQGTANVIRVQAEQSSLQVVQLFAVTNSSSPPRTLTGGNTLEFVLPEGAQLEGADAQGPNGQPISTIPEELKQKGHYAFSYALKPGETRFQVSYHMPYSGEATLSPAVLRAWNHLVVVLPASMKWTAKNASAFRPMSDQPDSTVQVATSVQPGQDLSFRVSGTGGFLSEEPAQDGAAASSPSTATNRPGGGLGPPIDAPDALAKYRWMILGVLAVVLSGGAYISVTRSPKFGHGEPLWRAPRHQPTRGRRDHCPRLVVCVGGRQVRGLRDFTERLRGQHTPRDRDRQRQTAARFH